jgi:8-oxo-dGTP pyrophosphatase MutT (NUDIX family)
MVLVFDADGRVLLVRHTYGDRRRWELPGGWVQRGEDPAVAAARELAEEVGLAGLELRPFAELQGEWDFKQEHLAVFAVDLPAGAGGTYDPVELAEVAWFDPDRPPPRVGQGTLAALARLADRPRA